MGAIKIHHTGTDEGAWDAGANEKKLKLDQDKAFYSRAYAWFDPEGDPTKKAAYKFIHHFVDGDGNPGAASTRACSAGIGVLNGGRGGTTIPDGDRQGVYNHLAAHLKDGEKDVPELKSLDAGEIERRCYKCELRVMEKDGKKRIAGHAAVFNQVSDNLGGWKEMILPGAFSDVLADDVRALFNHDPNLILGRTVANTLAISEDAAGLGYEITPPDTQYARDLLVSIERGDIDQSSFGFTVLEESWRNPTEEEPLPVRIIHKIQRLWDVSPVTFPAYPTTSVAVRDMAEQILRSAHATRDMERTSRGRATGEEEDAARAAGRRAMLRKRLELAEKD